MSRRTREGTRAHPMRDRRVIEVAIKRTAVGGSDVGDEARDDRHSRDGLTDTVRLSDDDGRADIRRHCVSLGLGHSSPLLASDSVRNGLGLVSLIVGWLVLSWSWTEWWPKTGARQLRQFREKAFEREKSARREKMGENLWLCPCESP